MSGYGATAHLDTTDTSPKRSIVKNKRAPNPQLVTTKPGNLAASGEEEDRELLFSLLVWELPPWLVLIMGVLSSLMKRKKHRAMATAVVMLLMMKLT